MIFNVFPLETLDKMTNLNFVKEKKKRFFWPLKVGSNLKLAKDKREF